MGCVKTEYVPVVRPCIQDEPPPKPIVKSTPCNYGVCYERYDAEKLAQWILDISDWSQLQFHACHGEEK